MTTGDVSTIHGLAFTEGTDGQIKKVTGKMKQDTATTLESITTEEDVTNTKGEREMEMEREGEGEREREGEVQWEGEGEGVREGGRGG